MRGGKRGGGKVAHEGAGGVVSGLRHSGIQVDLNQNPESLEGPAGGSDREEGSELKGLSSEERRKLKKKVNKKRRKEKAAEMQSRR